jgi:hypothetical protein
LAVSEARLGHDDVPEAVARAAELMSTFPGRWFLCGGWAVDAWVGGQTRDHLDVDLGVFEGDLEALRLHLEGWQLIAHDEADPDSTEPWAGRRLMLPAHIHARRDSFPELDVQACEQSGDEWLLSREPRLAVELGAAVEKSPWRLPALVPELILYYKALELRSQDEADFETLLPGLTEWQKNWLRQAIGRGQPEHPWLGRFA